jgi:hypothetical protein
MALIKSTAIPSGATDYELEQSLRFNDDDTAYLSKTPASAGNQKTWTFSCWVKKHLLLILNLLFIPHLAVILFLLLVFLVTAVEIQINVICITMMVAMIMVILQQGYLETILLGII